jgi:predicted flavoprotein YhiN
MGATPFGYRTGPPVWVKDSAHPASTGASGFGRHAQKQYCDLAGVSAEVIASADGAAFREKMLITHRGLSGPAILQVSSYWERGKPISLDLAPGREVTLAVREAKTRNASALQSAFQGILAKRFAERWVELHEPEAMTNADLAKFEQEIHAWSVTPVDTERLRK